MRAALFDTYLLHVSLIDQRSLETQKGAQTKGQIQYRD